MARVVEAVVSEFPEVIRQEIVITKTLAGALRHAELSKNHGRPVPVPAIVVDGTLAYDAIPGTEELRRYLERYMETGAFSINGSDCPT